MLAMLAGVLGTADGLSRDQGVGVAVFRRSFNHYKWRPVVLFFSESARRCTRMTCGLETTAAAEWGDLLELPSHERPQERDDPSCRQPY